MHTAIECQVVYSYIPPHLFGPGYRYVMFIYIPDQTEYLISSSIPWNHLKFISTFGIFSMKFPISPRNSGRLEYWPFRKLEN